MRTARLSAAAVLGLLTGFSTSSRAGDKPAAPPASGAVTVLGLQEGSFVGYARWKTPSVVTRSGTIAALMEPVRRDLEGENRKPMPAVAAEPPGKDWAAPGFDDSRWVRVRGPLLVPQGAWGYGLAGAGGATIYMPGNQVEWGLVCLRGTFRLDDLAQVKDLRLSLRYFGGVVVHVNGRELCRGHLPQGQVDFDTLADRYAEGAYLRPDGRFYTRADERKSADGMKVRVRELGDAADLESGTHGVPVPASMLRKGVNVIAVEAHAAPISEVMYAHTQPRGEETPWPHVGVLDARLTAASGVDANVGPGEGIELWTSQPLETVETWDYAHPVERIRPIKLVGARNGSFSGKVALSSKNSILDLKAAASDLTHEKAAGKVSATAIQVRWSERASPAVSWRNPPYHSNRFDRLLTSMPAEVAPSKATLGYGVKFQPAPAAVAPIWVTVRVPADAAPGDYRGTLTVEARGTKPASFAVPLELKVHDWRIPDPKDFTVHHNLYQSPDTVAQYYKVPLWSDKHFELMGKSLEVLNQVGNKLCVIYLVAVSSALNNSESMVRWVKKPDGSYRHDFTLLEKYLDLYAAKAGKPGILQINIWENNYSGAERQGYKPPVPLAVTVFDPATGKTEPMMQPPYGTPENEAFWKPVMTELRTRLEKRGWFNVAAVVNASYCWSPSKDVVTVFKNLWPDGKWMNATHSNPESYPAKLGSMPVPYSEWVWGSGFPLYDPDWGNREQRPFYPRAWKLGNRRIELSNPRAGSCIVDAIRDTSPLAMYRTISEAALQGNLRGVGRVGGDFWPLPAGKEGRFQPLCTDYGGCSMPNNTISVTSPGPDGAMFNERLEMFREGVQVAEAIIFVQRALEAGKIDGDLAKRAAALLDERARYYLRARFPHATCLLSYESSNWPERDDRLFALAAEAAGGTTASVAGEPLPERSAAAKPDLEYLRVGFENGSPLQWRVAPDGTVHVEMLYDYERGSLNRAAGHWHFQLQGKPGVDLTLVLHNFDNIYNGRPGAAVSRKSICYVSADGVKWSVIPTELLEGNCLRVRVHPEGGSLYLARLEPYRTGDLARLLDEIRGNRLVEVAEIGKTVEGRPLEIVRVGDAGAACRVLLRARAHAWEPGGNWVAQGLIRALLTDDEVSRKCLKRYCVYVMPMANKDGVARGLTRFNVQGRDLNRNWDKPADASLVPENYALEEWLKRLIAQGRAPQLVIDMHNDEGGGLAISRPPVKNLPEHVQRMQLLERLMNKHTWFTEGSSGPGHRNPGSIGEGLLERYGIDACILEFNCNWIAGLKQPPSGQAWEQFGRQLREVFFDYFGETAGR